MVSLVLNHPMQPQCRQMHHLDILCQLMSSTVQQIMRNSSSQELLTAVFSHLSRSGERWQATQLQTAQLQAAKLQQSILITAFG